MSDAIASAEAPPASRPAELQGLVDNATSTRLFGWAWNASRPTERVVVELRLGDETVASAVADRDRHDLAKAGVGDGHHAFELPLRPEWVARRSELAVVVRAADGTESGLALRVRRTDVDPTGAIQRVLEATAAAHRQLREELRDMARRGQDEPELLARAEERMRVLAEGQSALFEKLDTLALWLTRLDERLAALPAATPAPHRVLPAGSTRRDRFAVFGN
ncbi:MAG TPA: hypothetical protein VE684_12615, partial [Crenalkalicoccus sp.]|nr:hypothetical protein [Crenalkalicoccus sp.]